MFQTFCCSVLRMRFGALLKQARKDAKLTQERLAELVTSEGFNVSTSMISMIENEYDKTSTGEPTRVNKDFVLSAAKVLRMDINKALMSADYAPLSLPDTSVLAGYERLTPGAREIANRQIRSIIDSLLELPVIPIAVEDVLSEDVSERKRKVK